VAGVSEDTGGPLASPAGLRPRPTDGQEAGRSLLAGEDAHRRPGRPGGVSGGCLDLSFSLLCKEFTMNHRPARFRPCLEALEERSLLSIGFSLDVSPDTQGGMRLTIDASQSAVMNTISISNDGNGHITGTISGDPDGGGPLNGGAGFFNVSTLIIGGGPGGIAVSYSQTGPQVFGPGFYFVTSLAESTNSFAANLNDNAVTTGAERFLVYTSGGNNSISFNTAGVNIGPFASLVAVIYGNLSDPGPGVPEGQTSFSMDYSGVNRGGLNVGFDGFSDAHDVLSLDATFLGSPSKSASRFHNLFGPRGASPGDLSLTGGAGDNQMEMILGSPGGLSVTGDVFGGPDANTHFPGFQAHNSCVRTRNVHSHNCNPPDHVVGPPNLIVKHVLPGF
jgi:hypothetical protein